MRLADVLSSDPEIVSGAVVFKGTRVPVETLFEYLRGGSPIEEFLDDFPTVERQQVDDLLKVVADQLNHLDAA